MIPGYLMGPVNAKVNAVQGELFADRLQQAPCQECGGSFSKGCGEGAQRRENELRTTKSKLTLLMLIHSNAKL